MNQFLKISINEFFLDILFNLDYFITFNIIIVSQFFINKNIENIKKILCHCVFKKKLKFI